VNATSHAGANSASWQVGFLSVLPAVQTQAQFRFRKLPADRREDAIQEAIAAACVNYQLLAARGQLDVAHPSTLADFAVRHVNIGRHVGGKQDAAKDVLSPVCHKRHGVSVVSCHFHKSGDGADGWRQVVIAERKTSIPDTAAFRIDFPVWLKTLTRRDRKIIRSFLAGDSTSTVADRLAISPGRLSQLRRQFEHLWRTFHGEPLRNVA
jgi:hypothetical protein